LTFGRRAEANLSSEYLFTYDTIIKLTAGVQVGRTDARVVLLYVAPDLTAKRARGHRE
jgi:hypothetical protein